jgi:hypothetical protein
MMTGTINSDTPCHYSGCSNGDLRVLRIAEYLHASLQQSDPGERLLMAMHVQLLLLSIDLEDRIIKEIQNSAGPNLRAVRPVIARYLTIHRDVLGKYSS